MSQTTTVPLSRAEFTVLLNNGRSYLDRSDVVAALYRWADDLDKANTATDDGAKALRGVAKMLSEAGAG